MIQRVQSAYLLIGAIVVAVPFFVGFPELEATSPPGVATVWTVLFALTAALGLVAIFLYANRERQQIVAFWSQIAAALGVIVVVGGLILYGASGSGVSALYSDTPGVVAVLAPVVAAFMYRRARAGIARDINLIRSVDRLRD